jgi:hypothetical protein
VLGRLGRVDGQLQPCQRVPAVRARNSLRAGDELAAPLAQQHLLDRHERVAGHRAELGKNQPDPVAGSHGDNHDRDIGITLEELGVLAPPPGGAVGAAQDGSAGDAAPVQQFAGRLEGRNLVDTILATEVHGQPGRFARVLAQPDRVYLARQQPCPLGSDESGTRQRRHLVEHCLDTGPGVDRDRGRSLRTTQQNAGRHLLPTVQVYQGLAGRLAAHLLPFVEVAGQDDAVLVHALNSPPHQVWAEAIIRGCGGSGGCRLHVRASSDCHKITSVATRRTVPACADSSVLLAAGGR